MNETSNNQQYKRKISELNYKAVVSVCIFMSGVGFFSLYHFKEATLTLQCVLLCISGIILTLWVRRFPNYEIIATIILQIFFMGGIKENIITSILFMIIFLYAGAIQGFFILKIIDLKRHLSSFEINHKYYFIYHILFLATVFLYEKYIIEIILKLTHLLTLNTKFINISFTFLIYLLIVIIYIFLVKRISLVFLLLAVAIICIDILASLMNKNYSYNEILQVASCSSYCYLLLSLIGSYICTKFLIKKKKIY